MASALIFQPIFFKCKHLLCLVKIEKEESSHNASSQMNFHDDPDCFVGGQKSDYLSLEAMRSGDVKEHKDCNLKEKEPEKDDVNKLDHDMLIINLKITINTLGFKCSKSYYQKQMNYKQSSNRSLLAVAGSRSLNDFSPMTPQKLPEKPIKAAITQDKQIKKLMMKLTLPRLRKMQALVRGFLVRRKIYPVKLEQYLLAKSLTNLIISNVVYRQTSQLILESITYIKYEPNRDQILMGVQKQIQNDICDRLLQRVFHKQVEKVVEKAVIEHAKLITRPKITYGFNVRDPMQLFLFDIINNFVGMNYKEIVRQSIAECAAENRQLRMIDDWIDKHQLLHRLYEEIVDECLNESIGEYIVDHLLEKIGREGTEVVVRTVYDQEMERKQSQAYEVIQNKMIEWLLQQASLGAIQQLGHGITK